MNINPLFFRRRFSASKPVHHNHHSVQHGDARRFIARVDLGSSKVFCNYFRLSLSCCRRGMETGVSLGVPLCFSWSSFKPSQILSRANTPTHRVTKGPDIPCKPQQPTNTSADKQQTHPPPRARLETSDMRFHISSLHLYLCCAAFTYVLYELLVEQQPHQTNHRMPQRELLDQV
jgi:hypothetical protein